MTQLLKGQWWHPADNDNKVSGILSIGSADGPSLELIGALANAGVTDGGDEQEWPDTPGWVTPALHGGSEGKLVTVLGAYSPGTRNVMGATVSVEQNISTMYGVLVGGDSYVNSVDDPIFRVLEVELDYLTLWSGMDGIEFDHEDCVIGLKSTHAEALEADLDDWKLRIEKFTGSSTGKDHLGFKEANLTERCVLRIYSREKSSAKSFLEPARTFQNLLTHAMRKPSSIRSMKLFENEDLGHGLAYDWHRVEILPASDEVIHPRTRRNALFTALKIDFPQVVKSWYLIASQLGVTLDVLMGLDYSEHSYYENKLLNVATVIEAVHREFFPDSINRDPELHKTLKDLIKKAIPREHRGILTDFRNDPGYVQRCLELASIPDEAAVKSLLGDVRKWSQWTRNARNDLAHLNPEEGRKVPEEVWYRLASVTTALLHLVLMEKLQISSDLQKRAVDSGALNGASEGYLKASKEHL
ncbi:ApeA N-terminal domain 1-containing protein [Rhodococcus globerulus]|uniref:ApeA N-terminal domain-containing protein n=1 Tax=Rhodococcus globerulus TaxID=33008 RepID=A0ABU4C484_RHOGO|nr:HEPN domain-containing protein [Rhodococcus globerulus]MDV6271312.1 hypothetical protein [Rhodococcus globerulus]